MKTLLRLLPLVLSLSACVVQQPPSPGDPYYAPVMQTQPIPDQQANGSLYQENVAMNLFGDRKAARVGDIIRIILQERTSSSKSANVEIKKENDISGLDASTTRVLGVTPTISGGGVGINIQNDREFKGEADADQSNQLSGSISVTVVDIYPNGTLVVRGERWITLNRGSEFIRISGLIRADDISPQNTVLSTQIANAQIQYSGTGELADSQEMGWITRFFNSPVWPF